MKSNSKIKKLLNMGPTTVTGAGEATVKGKSWGGGGRSMALPTGTTTLQQHTTKGGPLDQRTEIPLV